MSTIYAHTHSKLIYFISKTTSSKWQRHLSIRNLFCLLTTFHADASKALSNNESNYYQISKNLTCTTMRGWGRGVRFDELIPTNTHFTNPRKYRRVIWRGLMIIYERSECHNPTKMKNSENAVSQIVQKPIARLSFQSRLMKCGSRQNVLVQLYPRLNVQFTW